MKTKRYITVFVICLLLVFQIAIIPVNAAGITTEDLSLDAALEQVKHGNPDLEKAALAMDLAQENRDDAVLGVSFIPDYGMMYPAYQTVFNGYQQTEIALDLAKQSKNTASDAVATATVGTYVAVLQTANNLELARLSLADGKKMHAIRTLSHDLGLMSDMDYLKAQNGQKQLENSYTIANNQYQSAVAALRALLNKADNWVPRLTSKPVLTSYPREALSVELSRGVEASSTVKQKKALLDIEQSKGSWVLTNVSSKTKANNLRTAEINYDETVKDIRSTIESDYHAIDSAELQITSAKLALASAQKDLERAKLSSKLGMLPAVSLTEGLNTYVLAEQKAALSLTNLQAALAQSKASFALTTGKKVYDQKDWVTESNLKK